MKWRNAFLNIAIPAVLFIAAYALRDGWPMNIKELGLVPDSVAAEQGGQLLSAICWIAFGFLFNRVCRTLIYRGILVRSGIQIPSMLITLVEVIVWVVILALVITGVYGKPMTALVATSTVLIGIAGFAVRTLIADFFSGIVLGMERPFSIGDWLQIDPGCIVGRVVEFNWRSTRIISTEDVTTIIPNSHLVSFPFKNFSVPYSYFRDEIRIPLGYEVTTHQGQRILLSAVNQIDEIANLPVRPSVTIAEYDNRGVVWILQYWIPDRSRLNALRFMVHQNILRNLHFAGLHIPVPVEDVRLRRDSLAGRDSSGRIVHLLGQSSLFAELTFDELENLASGAMQRICHANEPILTQGHAGSSLFILNEGLLAVWVSGPNGVEQQVAFIHPGEFFGELSLMTGAPRGATVIPVTDCLITEIGKDVMHEILTARPVLAESISLALADRQASNARSMASAGNSATTESKGIAQQILGQIRTFFNLVR